MTAPLHSSFTDNLSGFRNRAAIGLYVSGLMLRIYSNGGSKVLWDCLDLLIKSNGALRPAAKVFHALALLFSAETFMPLAKRSEPLWDTTVQKQWKKKTGAVVNASMLSAMFWECAMGFIRHVQKM